MSYSEDNKNYTTLIDTEKLYICNNRKSKQYYQEGHVTINATELPLLASKL